MIKNEIVDMHDRPIRVGDLVRAPFVESVESVSDRVYLIIAMGSSNAWGYATLLTDDGSIVEYFYDSLEKVK